MAGLPVLFSSDLKVRAVRWTCVWCQVVSIRVIFPSAPPRRRRGAEIAELGTADGFAPGAQASALDKGRSLCRPPLDWLSWRRVCLS